MNERISFRDVPQELMTAMITMDKYLNTTGLDKKLLELVKYRVSQINGCAFCLDMHHKDAIHHGETELRLHALPAWRECPWYSDPERAALAYADSLAMHADADDLTFTTLASFYNKKEITDLTFSIVLTNTWNYLNKAFRTTPGTYQVGQFS